MSLLTLCTLSSLLLLSSPQVEGPEARPTPPATPSVERPAAEPAPEEQAPGEPVPEEQGPDIQAPGEPPSDAQAPQLVDPEAGVEPEPGQEAQGSPLRSTKGAELTELELFVVGNLDGALARPDCREAKGLSRGSAFYAQMVALYRAMAAEEKQAPLSFNLGDSIFPSVLSRYLLSKGREGAERLATTLAKIPFDAMAIGNHDLSAPADETKAFFEAAAGKLGLVAANVECAEGATAPICAIAPSASRPDHIILQRGALKLGVTAMLDPSIADAIPKAQKAGATFLEPKESLSYVVRKLREEKKVDLVVVLFHMAGSAPFERLHRMISTVPGVDLLLTNVALGDGAGAEGLSQARENGYSAVAGTGTFLVGSDGGNRNAVLVRLEASRMPGEAWRIKNLSSLRSPVGAYAPEEEVREQLSQVAGELCRDWGAPIAPGAELAHPFTFADFQTFVLNVMRSSIHGEVAFSNAAAFRDAQRFPLAKELTRSDLYSALPYDTGLVEVSLPGSVLAGLAPKLGNELLAVGLEPQPDGKVLINGRPLDPSRRYKVALNSYLAEGGDGHFAAPLAGAKLVTPDWASESPAISDFVRNFVESGEYEKEGLAQLSPTENFPDLSREFEWHYLASVRTGYNKVEVDNPGDAYTTSQLTASSTDLFDFELKAAADADSLIHTWTNEFLAQYALARIDDKDPSTKDRAEKTKDLIKLRSAYKLSWVRLMLGDHPYTPVPLVEGQVESEFEPVDWRKVLTTGILGASFRLLPPLDAKVGLNIRRDLNAPTSDFTSETTWGLNLGYTLKRIRLADLYGRPLLFESDLEYFFNSIGIENISDLQNHNRLSVNIFDRLSFSLDLAAILYRSKSVGSTGTNTQVNFGLEYRFEDVVPAG